MRVRLVRDELVVHHRRADAFGAVPPAQDIEELGLEILRVLHVVEGGGPSMFQA